MLIPAKQLCDLCRAELVPHQPHARLSYPLDGRERETFRRSIEIPESLLGIATVLLPDCYVFDFCVGCVDGFMPMLAELKAQAIEGLIRERRKRAEASRG